MAWLQTITSISALAVGLGTMWRWAILPLKHDVVTLGNKVDGVERSLSTRIDGVERGLSTRIDGVERSLSARIDGVERSLSARIDGVERRIDGVERRIDGVEHRVDGVEHRLTTRIDGLHRGLKAVADQVTSITRVVTPLALSAYHDMTGSSGFLLHFNGSWDGARVLETTVGNPLTKEELARFSAYQVKVMQQLRPLTLEEVFDFRAMVEKILEGPHYAPGTGSLLVLASYLEDLARDEAFAAEMNAAADKAEAERQAAAAGDPPAAAPS